MTFTSDNHINSSSTKNETVPSKKVPPETVSSASTTADLKKLVSKKVVRQPVGSLVWRGLRLRCPLCGKGKLFTGWFKMTPCCNECGRNFNRDPGYLLGSIYFNYAATAFQVVIIYFACFFTEIITGKTLVAVTFAYGGLFPIWFFRYARSLWIAFYELCDPWDPENDTNKIES